MHITCFECDEYEQRVLREQLSDHALSFFTHPLGEDEPWEKISRTDILVIFIYSRITVDVLKHFPFLKLIVTLSTGYDHIDVAACKEQGITVCNVPKYGGTAVAEHTFAIMLALLRHIPTAVKNTEHDDFSLDNLCGTELAGKTLGIIGAGTIGSAVAKRAQAFDMRVLVYERTPNKQLAKETSVIQVPLTTLLKESDIVSLHVPYTKETRHIIDKKKIKMMKKGAYIINTARGALIDSTALHQALVSRHLAGAALDVLEGEYEHKEAHAPRKEHHLNRHDWSLIRETHRLLKLPNVLITPHMAFYTHEAINTILTKSIENIRNFEKGLISSSVA